MNRSRPQGGAQACFCGSFVLWQRRLETRYHDQKEGSLRPMLSHCTLDDWPLQIPQMLKSQLSTPFPAARDWQCFHSPLIFRRFSLWFSVLVVISIWGNSRCVTLTSFGVGKQTIHPFPWPTLQLAVGWKYPSTAWEEAENTPWTGHKLFTFTLGIF